MAKLACRQVRMAPEALACLRLEETRLANIIVHERVVQQCGPACGTALVFLFREAVQREADPLELAQQELKRVPAAVAASQIVVKVVTASVLTLHPCEERRIGHNFTARSRELQHGFGGHLWRPGGTDRLCWKGRRSVCNTLQWVGWPRQLRMRGVVCSQAGA